MSIGTVAPEELVSRFCSAWGEGDLDAVLDYFTEDAVYHNIPLDPVSGRAAIKAMIESIMAGADRIEFKVSNIAVNGSVVMTERVDVFHNPQVIVELPVMGTFEVKGSKIAAWRDYFDLNQFTSQLPGSGG